MVINTKTQNQLLSFPCEFEIKVIGKSCPEFETEVLIAVKKFAPDLKQNCLKENHSKSKNYLSISVKINATSQEQLNNIYRELNKCKDVIMTL